jgi:hypothetical protein
LPTQAYKKTRKCFTYILSSLLIPLPFPSASQPFALIAPALPSLYPQAWRLSWSSMATSTSEAQRDAAKSKALQKQIGMLVVRTQLYGTKIVHTFGDALHIMGTSEGEVDEEQLTVE